MIFELPISVVPQGNQQPEQRGGGGGEACARPSAAAAEPAVSIPEPRAFVAESGRGAAAGESAGAAAEAHGGIQPGGSLRPPPRPQYHRLPAGRNVRLHAFQKTYCCGTLFMGLKCLYANKARTCKLKPQTILSTHNVCKRATKQMHCVEETNEAAFKECFMDRVRNSISLRICRTSAQTTKTSGIRL